MAPLFPPNLLPPTRNQNELVWTVVVGDHELGKPDVGERTVPVRRILPHPKVGGGGYTLISLYMLQGIPQHTAVSFQFNPKTFHGDLALLELAVPLASSPTVSPVCLPSSPAEPSPGTACYIVGWGSLYEGRCHPSTCRVWGFPLSAVSSAGALSQGMGVQKRGGVPGHGEPHNRCVAWQRGQQPTW